MLKQRVITAIVLAAVFLGVLFFLPIPLFPAFVATIVLISAWEWANLCGFTALWQRALYVIFQAAAIAGAALYVGALPLGGATPIDAELHYRPILIAGCTWWALALLWVQGYPTSALLWRHPALRAVMGFFVLVPTWAGLSYVRLQEQGAWLVLMIVAVVATADIGGYFVGRRFGQRKLAPNVSPGKTWEGFLGGVSANVCLALLVWFFTGQALWAIIALVLPTSLVSVLGDLLESMVKRERGIKDSSALLPGHGGVLDRVDSLTAAVPVFALALTAVDVTLG
ncbi:phosphatidate cytidylyltransferase [Gilvimarinus agarilyticus]|uniref:phosphatidate cytidylyltransferase n=1 Tax=Gilvimarinus sp. 2_MG-2023 TaxID=3062666 RepID=UPI001C0A19C4|nr:phosphatidate cytidylyltransferase [Gilvimarinus sp. 2_MG-2023]MBU2886976.1 phosphatidate cytidylyltransferase [Gilvimarinus agarilyticus]MDO6571636.1 phosphatidate cytidylyltransferase [Gilvimarinus sp. 2_MG-2023]